MDELIFEGIAFNRSLCSKMSKKEFISRHESLFPDRDKEEREKLLSDIYLQLKPAAKAAE